jgi:hypothetical protein
MAAATTVPAGTAVERPFMVIRIELRMSAIPYISYSRDANHFLFIWARDHESANLEGE